MKCCNNKLELKKGNKDGQEWFYYFCEKCKKLGKGKNENEAIENFNSVINKNEIILKKNNILNWAQSNMHHLIEQSAGFIEKPATEIMIRKNINYISNLNGKSWDKIWESEEGISSISLALAESLYYGATLPDMGSIVPFGATAEFIPSVECYKFALETGKNAPFKDINIFLIHKNDQTKVSQVNGNFIIEIEYSIPRGEILAVVVQATKNDTDKIIGEVYDVERLIGKAKIHSSAYRNYLIDKELFNKHKIEGLLKTDENGRNYFEKKIEYQKNGSKKTFNKKIYELDIVNPYDGADKPEMLKKAAGKSFFRPYMRTRNATAMADEWTDVHNKDEEFEQRVEKTLDSAKKQFNNENINIKEAEIIKDENVYDEKEKFNL